VRYAFEPVGSDEAAAVAAPAACVIASRR
jgi:hypothetical protein